MLRENTFEKTDSAMKLGTRNFTREETALIAIAVAMEKKAFRPVLLDLRSQGAFTEMFAILSATNARQVTAVAEGVRLFFKNTFGLNPVAVDGLESQTWVLIDYGFLFIHVFQEPTRELYQLEQLWSKGRLIQLNEDAIHELFTEVKTLSAPPEDDAESM